MKTKEEIKKWLDEKKEFTSDEFIQWFEGGEIDIPEGIRFFDLNKDYSLGLVFNSGRQILVIDRDDNVFETLSYNYIQKIGIEEIPCELVECKYEDLVVGDIFIYCSKEEDIKDKKESLDEYILFLGNNNCTYIKYKTDIRNFKITPSFYTHIFKVVKK